jgi:hypothetical protein
MTPDPHRRRSVRLGLLLGAGFGVWNLLVTWLAPLVDDSPATLMGFYGPMFAVWAWAGYAAVRRTGELRRGAATGALVAFVTFLVFDLTVIARVNVFLDQLRPRADWQNLVARYPSSGFHSFRAYVNYRYVTGAPFKIAVATLVGAGLGALGGAAGRHGRKRLVGSAG